MINRSHMVRIPYSILRRWISKTKTETPSNVTSQVKVLNRLNNEKGKLMGKVISEERDIRAILEQDREIIDSEITRLASHIKEAACELDRAQARVAFEILIKMAEAKRLVSNAAEVLVADGSVPLYLLGSMFLHDSNRYLVKHDVEALHFVTGMQIDGGFTMDKMIEVGMSRQTPVSAVGDTESTHNALIDMESYGHKLVACFHSHPGKGVGATTPSSTDLDHQARMEQGGYVAIGGIFSRDGYFRAFSFDMTFRLEVYGKGVERIDDKLYRLIDIN